MTGGSNITKKQHYIPQVYLRGFSPEYKKGNIDLAYSRYTIYCYNLAEKKQIDKAIPIKSVCYGKNLYEVTGVKGAIVPPNYLEHCFAMLEKSFSVYRSKLECKAFIEDNYKTRCFLKREEKEFWLTYILIQILRMPQILEAAEGVSLEIYKDTINAKQAKNIARTFCLPFFKEIKEDSKEKIVLDALFDPMKNMSFGVGVDRQARIITSDKPVFIHSKEFPCKEYDRVIFPITSKVCLILFGKDDKKQYPKNFLFPIGDMEREVIFKSMVASSFEKIYSNHLLEEKEKKLVEEVLAKKGGKVSGIF